MMIINCRLLVPCRDRRMVLADDCILRFEVSSSKHFILFRTLGMVERWKFLGTLSRTKLTTLLSYLKLFRISLQRFVFWDANETNKVARFERFFLRHVLAFNCNDVIITVIVFSVHFVFRSCVHVDSILLLDSAGGFVDSRLGRGWPRERHHAAPKRRPK